MSPMSLFQAAPKVSSKLPLARSSLSMSKVGAENSCVGLREKEKSSGFKILPRLAGALRISAQLTEDFGGSMDDCGKDPTPLSDFLPVFRMFSLVNVDGISGLEVVGRSTSKHLASGFQSPFLQWSHT